ncbi:MAG: translation elongation factor-like protein [Candidatus Omnitrophica bacterium]|nr:translation elongation factor-like protein [Candidatus Omnitrophota bacterium]
MTHYFGHCKAGVIKLTDTLSVGDTIHIKGHTTDLKQKIHSMQIDGKEVPTATNGKEVGILVKKRLRQHDKVYKL